MPKDKNATTGGCVKTGSHLIKLWSNTQSAISLSSGEVEHDVIVKAVGIGLGVQEFLRYLGVNLSLHVHTDSVATKGIANRVGLGTQRHVAINTLWVQEKFRCKMFQLHKIKGDKTNWLTYSLSTFRRTRC